jgi:hypothetical protein
MNTLLVLWILWALAGSPASPLTQTAEPVGVYPTRAECARFAAAIRKAAAAEGLPGPKGPPGPPAPPPPPVIIHRVCLPDVFDLNQPMRSRGKP